MNYTKRLTDAVHFAENFSANMRLEFLIPETLLVGIVCRNEEFMRLCDSYHVDYQKQIKEPIYAHHTEHVPEDIEYILLPSAQYIQMLTIAEENAKNADKEELDVPHILNAMLQLKESYANYILRTAFSEDEATLMRHITDAYEGRPLPNHQDDDYDFDYDDVFGSGRKAKWEDLVTCVNDHLADHNPLIGREPELDRTIQILCRRDKNNPLHVGEPGVGKTALIYGLAQRIVDGKVPKRLQGAKIYQLDIGTLVAGTQYRGDFEERINTIMKGASEQDNAIIYIDEIHTLIGAGEVSDGSLDGSNMLKPYLEDGKIRFIGATTYKEYNKYFQKSQGIVRRFQMVDVKEPTKEETVHILEGLQNRYETFHNVHYDEGIMRYAVELSLRHITDRFLPDKAIDIIDEAGAYREMHPDENVKSQVVNKELINQVVKKICKLTDEMLSASDTGSEALATLETKIQSQIYGQDKAIRQVVEAVQMSKAGLSDPNKPLASLLFVGPTGVGKTELCNVLAHELGIELVRFDMSEYTEKHTIAKLIGSPAGYVGYDDGGLLTDAIRRSPNCVLLLDEIEKAHQDIYNILLQIMDYARLTDNRGNKADFKNVILIMTSNAGAQFASMASVGFGNNTTRGEAMLQTVKKTFKPEFINRLSGMVVFNDMDHHMARLILDKKLRQLCDRLAKKNVVMTLTDEAKEYLLNKGYTTQYGAREMDRIIQNLLNPLLIREILFGKLQNGGKAKVYMKNEEMKIKV